MNIDPKNITNFSRTTAELQSFWLFSLFVAGKNSDYAAGCLARLLHKARFNEQNPFDYLRELGETGIHNALVAAKVGQYSRLTKAIVQYPCSSSTATCSEAVCTVGRWPGRSGTR